jgi:A/G-specific adenine glycosylase
MSLVGQPVRAPCELAPEAVEHIPWLRGRLLSWFACDGRTFPWREPGRTPYEVVVAEILLQRTTAAGVARAYPGFIEHFPSWTALAHAPLDCIENELRPLGLWRQKALAFQQLARSIEGRGRIVPSKRAELEPLPGIGPYTASPLRRGPDARCTRSPFVS